MEEKDERVAKITAPQIGQHGYESHQYEYNYGCEIFKHWREGILVETLYGAAGRMAFDKVVK